MTAKSDEGMREWDKLVRDWKEGQVPQQKDWQILVEGLKEAHE